MTEFGKWKSLPTLSERPDTGSQYGLLLHVKCRNITIVACVLCFKILLLVLQMPIFG